MSEAPPKSPPQGAPLSCAEVRPYLSAFVDGELAEPLRSQVARHLTGCAECSARAEGYRATDALLASLPRTTPAPEVFHAVMAAAREENAVPVERETLAGPLAGLLPRPLHIVRPEPRRTDIPAALPRARKKSWVATVAPAVAALLLVTLATLAFRGLVLAPRDTRTASTPTPTGTIVERTQSQVAAVERTYPLPFSPVLPAYAPDGVSGVNVSLGYADDKTTIIYLDIGWTVTSNQYLREVLIRETRSGYDYYGYTTDASDNAMGWRLNDHVWEPLRNESQITEANPGNSVAAGEHRDTLSITVEAIGTSPLANVDSLKTTLRQVTLSMDGLNKPIPLSSHPPTGLVLHYVAQSRITNGATPPWSAEVYVNPATDAQSVAVSANGTLRYVDVSQGARGYRWDVRANTYSIGPRSAFSGDMTPTATGSGNVLQIFNDAGVLLQNGLLWYSGQNVKVLGVNAYDYLLVSAPNKTHVYIDQTTSQVVELKVESNVTWNIPSSTDRVFGNDGCSYFTLIEYRQPEDIPARTFSLTPPPSSHQDQGHVPATVKCS
jgi:hypothetical protein